MDKFSFLNAVHAQLVDDMYEQYKKYPDALNLLGKLFSKVLILHWKITAMKMRHHSPFLNPLQFNMLSKQLQTMLFQKIFQKNSK